MLIDFENLFLRSFLVSPQMDKNGNLIGGTVGFLKSIAALTKQYMPKQVYIVYETGGSPRRLKIYPEYKEKRKPKSPNRFYGDMIPDTEENQTYQKQAIIEILKHIPVVQLHVENCEADDVIGYLCKSIFPDEEKIIVSSDKDFYQLIDDKTKIWRPGKKVFVKADDVIKEFNIAPNNFCVAKALNGDPSDNIPGVGGVGFKTLAKRFDMVSKEVSVDDILNESKKHVDEDKKPLSIFKNIAINEELIKRNMELIKLDNKLLSVDQIQLINRIVNEFKPTWNRINVWKLCLELNLDGLKVDEFCNCFHFLVHSYNK